MNILFIGNFGQGWDGSICDEKHILEALGELGHTVKGLQRENAWKPLPLTRWVNDGKYDFILISQWDGYEKDLIQKLKQKLPDTSVVYWAFDYQADGQEWHERLVKESDLYLSKRIADSKYSNWQWLSQDFAPKFLDKTPNKAVEKDIDVLFTGSYLPWATERNDTLRAVAQKFNLVIHSVNSWPEEWGLDIRPPIMDEGLPELYAKAKIVLSIDHTIEAGYWSDRLAQIMCCGGFPLHRYQPLHEAVYGGMVNYFYGIDSCLKGIRYWLEEDETREMIAAKQYEWAQSKLKVINRVNDLICIVENHLENRTV